MFDNLRLELQRDTLRNYPKGSYARYPFTIQKHYPWGTVVLLVEGGSRRSVSNQIPLLLQRHISR